MTGLDPHERDELEQLVGLCHAYRFFIVTTDREREQLLGLAAAAVVGGFLRAHRG